VEAFEHLVKVALESDGLIVAGNLKFYVTMRTRRSDRKESQRHGYEVDLAGAKRDQLILASVKSHFGSHGVNRQGFVGVADESKRTHFDRYKLFNVPGIREGVINAAAKQFGYSKRQVELRLYVGRFQNDAERELITRHLGRIRAGSGKVKVFGLKEILESLLRVAESRTYVNDPVVMTLKALKHAKLLK
jgi:hypothetical protein